MSSKIVSRGSLWFGTGSTSGQGLAHCHLSKLTRYRRRATKPFCSEVACCCRLCRSEEQKGSSELIENHFFRPANSLTVHLRIKVVLAADKAFVDAKNPLVRSGLASPVVRQPHRRRTAGRGFGQLNRAGTRQGQHHIPRHRVGQRLTSLLGPSSFCVEPQHAESLVVIEPGGHVDRLHLSLSTCPRGGCQVQSRERSS